MSNQSHHPQPDPASKMQNVVIDEELPFNQCQTEVANLNFQLDQQSRFFEAVFSSINDFAYAFNKQGQFLYANQSLLDLWGLKLEDAVGKNFFDLKYPDELAAKLGRQIQQVFDTNQRVKDETPYISPTGIDGFYEYIFSPVAGADGSVEIVAGTTRDITVHKQTVEKLRLAEELSQGTINALTGHIAVLDKNNVIVKVNQTWRNFAEENLYSGTNYGIGQNYLEVCLESADSELPEGREAGDGIRRVASGELDLFELEYPCHSAQEQRWFVMRVTRFLASNDTVRIVVAHENVTDRKLAESALYDANRRKDEFLATLAHELRNPLAPIRSGLEVIRRLSDDKVKFVETLNTIERQTNQIVHLVDDLLDISRITQGKIKLKKERIELRTAIEIALETSQALIDETANELNIILPDEPIFIDADITRIAQIFLNILNNAAKYSDPGGKISLVGRAVENDAVISIKDTGLGIAPEMLPGIFDMFGQIETSEEQARGGLGIGLSVVKKLVEMHGGNVEAFSDGLGKGSEFIVQLPLAIEQSERIPAEPVSETDIIQTVQMEMPIDDKKSDSHSDTEHFRILVVDDNADAVEMLATLLSMQGHVVRTAFDAPAGIRIAAEFEPEICLSDIGLPGMNGYELAAQLRGMFPQSLLISISGWGQDEDRQKSKEAGFNYHLVKPVHFDDLLKLIELNSIENE